MVPPAHTPDDGNAARIPRHIAIVMDGNGRWAQRRHRPRGFGHQEGVRNAQRIAEACADRGVEAMTVFAFSSENWQRPDSEVARLMDLFARALKREVDSFDKSGIRLRFIGALDRFSPELREGMAGAAERTANNTRMDLAVAVNYGGRWDIVQAARRLLAEGHAPEDVDEPRFHSYLSLADLPPPDLLIRTGGEKRISNFLLWQIAYTELHFTDTLWPDFGMSSLEAALHAFNARQRRFGRTSGQISAGDDA